jgi:two-component system response regulator NreC
LARIKVLLVDDSLQFVEALKEYFSSSPEFPVIGWAESGGSAIQKVQELQPDLVFMDIFMPGMNGLEATRQIKRLSNPPRVIMLTVFDAAEYRKASADVGADGFICKSDFVKEAPIALKKLFGAESYIPEARASDSLTDRNNKISS